MYRASPAPSDGPVCACWRDGRDGLGGFKQLMGHWDWLDQQWPVFGPMGRAAAGPEARPGMGPALLAAEASGWWEDKRRKRHVKRRSAGRSSPVWRGNPGRGTPDGWACRKAIPARIPACRSSRLCVQVQSTHELGTARAGHSDASQPECPVHHKRQLLPATEGHYYSSVQALVLQISHRAEGT